MSFVAVCKDSYCNPSLFILAAPVSPKLEPAVTPCNLHIFLHVTTKPQNGMAGSVKLCNDAVT